jgi:UDP-glucose 4-epimerase
MKKVLVTGGAGFIGAHLVAARAARSTEVVVLDNLKRPSRAKAEALSRLARVRFVEGDIRSFELLAGLMRSADVVFHLAAQSNVLGAAVDPDYSISTNVLGTFNVLRSAAEAGVPRVVFTSSREVYGDPKALPVDEDAPLLAKNAYGASKVAGEAYCRTFGSSRLSVEVLRLANVYGAGDSERVIPLWLAAANDEQELRVYGGEQVIDFLWVGTCVDALLFAAEHGLPGPVNVGSGIGTKILDLANRVLEVSRSASKVVRVAAREIEVARFVADTRRMRSLGLTPEADPLAHLGELVGHYGARQPIQ